jgi:hypothetical protein
MPVKARIAPAFSPPSDMDGAQRGPREMHAANRDCAIRFPSDPIHHVKRAARARLHEQARLRRDDCGSSELRTNNEQLSSHMRR